MPTGTGRTDGRQTRGHEPEGARTEQLIQQLQQGRLQELLKEPPATQSDRAGYETFAALTRSDPTSGGVHHASPVAAFQGLSGLPCAYSR